MPSRASSSLDLVLTTSCGLTLQICLIIALSFCCRCWRYGFVNGKVSLAWSIALRTQELYTRPHVLKERWLEERTIIIGKIQNRRFFFVFTNKRIFVPFSYKIMPIYHLQTKILKKRLFGSKYLMQRMNLAESMFLKLLTYNLSHNIQQSQ